MTLHCPARTGCTTAASWAQKSMMQVTSCACPAIDVDIDDYDDDDTIIMTAAAVAAAAVAAAAADNCIFSLDHFHIYNPPTLNAKT